MAAYMQIVTTTKTREEAEKIASGLVHQSLAACVQVSGPIVSFYRWNDVIERSEEWRCVAKSRADRFDDVAAAIRTLHSYDVPEVVATPITAISASYQEWLDGL